MTRGRKDIAQRDGQLVARRSYLPFEKRVIENEMPADDQPCLQHCTKQKCELDLECLQRACGTKILRLTFRRKMQPGEEWVAYKARTARSLPARLKKLGPPSLAELLC